MNSSLNPCGKVVDTMRMTLIVLMIGAFALAAAGQRGLVEMEVRPLFGTTVPSYGCLPLKISIRNDGPSLDTTLVVEPARWRGMRRHLFPLPLPTGSRKEIVALPFVMSGTTTVSVRLEGVRPVLEKTLSVAPSESVRLVVAVGDEIGGLEWLQKLNPQPVTTPTLPRAPTPIGPPGAPVPTEWRWVYCRPEDLPDKTAALTGVSVLVLGTGAERLSTRQWRAIRRWIALGGVLVVPGGSAAIYLRHAALAPLLPVQNWRTRQWSDWVTLSRWLGTPAPKEPAFITVGDLTPDAQLFAGTPQAPLVAMRAHGYGSVLFVAFNLWDKPFRGWQGLPELWKRAVVPLTKVTVAQRWASWLLPLGEWQGWQPARYRYYPTPPYPIPPSSVSPSPFQLPPLPFRLELPSLANIAVMMGIYFAFIVPLSYILLRRFRRLDVHWLTAPILAVAFVFLVGRATFWLYQLGTQNLTRGLVILAAGERDSYLFAGTTLFIQQSGAYQVDFGEAEGVFAQLDGDELFGETGLTTQEGASVTTPLFVPNLSFRLLYFVKPITLNGTVAIQSKRQGHRLVVTVTNLLPFPLKEGCCQLVHVQQVSPPEPWMSAGFQVLPFSTTTLPIVEPNQSATVTLPLPSYPFPTATSLHLWVTAQVDGIDITPNLNTSAHRKSYVTLGVVKPLTPSVGH